MIQIGVPFHEDNYEVTSDGRIWSNKRSRYLTVRHDGTVPFTYSKLSAQFDPTIIASIIFKPSNERYTDKEDKTLDKLFKLSRQPNNTKVQDTRLNSVVYIKLLDKWVMFDKFTTRSAAESSMDNISNTTSRVRTTCGTSYFIPMWAVSKEGSMCAMVSSISPPHSLGVSKHSCDAIIGKTEIYIRKGHRLYITTIDKVHHIEIVQTGADGLGRIMSRYLDTAQSNG
jgi:hypothetical protein